MSHRARSQTAIWGMLTATAVVAAPLGATWGDHLFDPPLGPTEYEWAGSGEWRGNAPYLNWEIWDPDFTYYLVNDPDWGVVPGDPEDEDHDITIPSASLPDSADPAGARLLFTHKGSTDVVVDEPSTGKSSWEVYSITFQSGRSYTWEAGDEADPDADPPDPGSPPTADIDSVAQQSFTFSGNPIFLGAGGMDQTSHTGVVPRQTFENDIWIMDDVVIDVYSNFRGDKIVTTVGGQANDLTFSHTTSINTVIEGDGDVTYTREAGIFRNQAYTGDTTLAGVIVVLGAEDAFGQGENVYVTGDSRFVGVSEGTSFSNGTIVGEQIAHSGAITLDYDFFLSGDLEFGSFTPDPDLATPVTIAGDVSLVGGDREITTLQGANATLSGLVDLQESGTPRSLTLFTDGDSQLTINGPVDGSGDLIKNGPGTLRLLGDNSYTGDTYFHDGFVELGDSNALGDSETLILEGRTFVRALAPITLDQAVVLNDDLELTQNSAAFTFDAPIDVDADAALRVQSDQPTVISENSGVDLAANFTVRGAGNLTINAAITGTGDLTKDGSGTLTLTEENTYMGDTLIQENSIVRLLDGGTIGHAAHSTTVQNSTLIVRDGSSVFGDLDVDENAILRGAGEITGDMVARNRSVIRPGDSIGTLNIGGDAHWESGSQTFIEYDMAGGNDRINVAGAATIDAGAEFLMGHVGQGFVRGGHQFLIVESTDLTVADIESLGVESHNSLFVNFIIDEDEIVNNDNLVVLSQRTSMESLAEGENNLTLAKGLEGILDGDMDSQTVAMLTAIDQSANAAEYNEKLRQLSPTTYTGTVNATFESTRGSMATCFRMPACRSRAATAWALTSTCSPTAGAATPCKAPPPPPPPRFSPTSGMTTTATGWATTTSRGARRAPNRRPDDPSLGPIDATTGPRPHAPAGRAWKTAGTFSPPPTASMTTWTPPANGPASKPPPAASSSARTTPSTKTSLSASAAAMPSPTSPSAKAVAMATSTASASDPTSA